MVIVVRSIAAELVPLVSSAGNLGLIAVVFDSDRSSFSAYVVLRH